jgi:Nif-specific regulatory protein
MKADVRIITATNRNLEALIHAGKFREDLFYRLNVFPILVPPLRERKTDIMLLADHFIEKYSKEHEKKIVSISTSATDMFIDYHWPGNVRELENYIERAVILSNDGVIHSYHLPPNLQRANTSVALEARGSFKDIMTNMEREIILEELKKCRGNMAKAGRALGITERMMGLRIAKHEIDPAQFK